MTHEFSSYSPEEQKEFLSLVQQMEWEPKVGDWCYCPIDGNRSEIIGIWLNDKEAMIITNWKREPFLRYGKYSNARWLPQAHDLLEMLREISEKLPNTDYWLPIESPWDLVRERVGKSSGGMKVDSPHLCLALARAVKVCQSGLDEVE